MRADSITVLKFLRNRGTRHPIQPVYASEPMKNVFVALFALLTAACTTLPAQPIAGLDPADPESPVPPVRAENAFGTYLSQRPVGPAPWREQNERVAPKAKQ
jgi:hypothetical protein